MVQSSNPYLFNSETRMPCRTVSNILYNPRPMMSVAFNPVKDEVTKCYSPKLFSRLNSPGSAFPCLRDKPLHHPRGTLLDSLLYVCISSTGQPRTQHRTPVVGWSIQEGSGTIFSEHLSQVCPTLVIPATHFCSDLWLSYISQRLTDADVNYLESKLHSSLQ